MTLFAGQGVLLARLQKSVFPWVYVGNAFLAAGDICRVQLHKKCFGSVRLYLLFSVHWSLFRNSLMFKKKKAWLIEIDNTGTWIIKIATEMEKLLSTLNKTVFYLTNLFFVFILKFQFHLMFFFVLIMSEFCISAKNMSPQSIFRSSCFWRCSVTSQFPYK